jgi:hypothetical protein
MARGLAWTLLLIFFSVLTWLGWSEYAKIEAYKRWAVQFEQAKYDIAAALGQTQDLLTWGKPTRQGPVELQTLSLHQVASIALQVDGQTIDPLAPPKRGKQIQLALTVSEQDNPRLIGFTEIDLALRWLEHLQKYVSVMT